MKFTWAIFLQSLLSTFLFRIAQQKYHTEQRDILIFYLFTDNMNIKKFIDPLIVMAEVTTLYEYYKHSL